MVCQKQMCAKRKNCNIPKILLSSSYSEFSSEKSHRWFQTHKTSGEDGGSEGQLNFVNFDIVHSQIDILFPLHQLPLHQPAPVSPKRRIEYFKYRFFASLDEINTCHIHSNKQIQRIYVPRHYCTLKND